MFTDPVTGELVNGIRSVRWHQDAVIDFMLANPTAKQGEIARRFERSETWISIMVNSDAFKARLAERKAELVDPVIQAEVKDRLAAVAAESLTRMLEKLTNPAGVSDDFVLKSAKLSVEALGYGARAPSSGASGPAVSVVVNVPAKLSQADWSAKYAGPGALSPPQDAVEVPSQESQK